jgi:integrase
LHAEKFGPLSLQQVRQSLLASGRYCRKEINSRIHRIRRAFRWAAANERIAGTVVHNLSTVDGLKAGRCGARESEPVRPVPYEHVLAVLPHLPPTVASMVKLQALTAARPDEICSLRMRHLDRSGKVWIATLEQHKNAWRGHRRTLRFDSFAQEVIRPYLRPSPEAFLFSPAKSEQERHATKRLQRKTKVPPSQLRRGEVACKRSRKRAPRENYDVNSYRQAIQRGCAAASAEGRRAAILDAIPESVRKLFEKTVSRLPVVLSESRLANALQREAERHRLPDAKGIAAQGIEALRNHPEDVPAWAPNQLRHSGATVARMLEGLDGSQALLGHKKADVTQVYAELEDSRGILVAERVGAEIARRLHLAR